MLLLILLDDRLVCFLEVLGQNNIAVLTDSQHSTLKEGQELKSIPVLPTDGKGTESWAHTPGRQRRIGAVVSERRSLYIYTPCQMQRETGTYLLTDGVDISS